MARDLSASFRYLVSQNAIFDLILIAEEESKIRDLNSVCETRLLL